MSIPWNFIVHDNMGDPNRLGAINVDGGVIAGALCLRVGELTLIMSPDRLRKLHDVIGDALAKMPPAVDPQWCYVCDRPKADCACIDYETLTALGTPLTPETFRQSLEYHGAPPAPLDGSEFALDENAAVKLRREARPIVTILDRAVDLAL